MAVFSILLKMFFFRNTNPQVLMILFYLCDSDGRNTQECHSSLRIFLRHSLTALFGGCVTRMSVFIHQQSLVFLPTSPLYPGQAQNILAV
jgi:hypothetical protein